MIARLFKVSFFFLFLIFYTAIADTVEFPLLVHGEPIDLEYIEQRMQEPWLLESVTYTTDIALNSAEFYYLVELRAGTKINARDVYKAAIFLQKKNKFQDIRLQVTDGDKGKKVHFVLDSFWTFKKLVLHGIWAGKEAYRRYYVLEPGDCFEQDKHEYSLQKMKEALKQEGYCNNIVHSCCTYDNKTKSVIVHCTLKRKDRFFITNVKIVVQGDQTMRADDSKVLQDYLYKHFVKHLERRHYSKQLLAQQSKTIKEYLNQQGFLQSDITLSEHINHEQATVDLVWTIHVQHKRTFIFFGNHFFSTQYLKNHISQFGRSAWLIPTSVLVEELINVYRNKGFWQVSVEGQDEDNRSFFLIKEGKRTSIKDITINHAYAADAAWLIKQFFSSVRAHYYEADLLEKAKNDLTFWYQQQGFTDFSIIGTDFVSEAQPDMVNLVITVEERTQKYIATVAIPEFSELENQGPFVLVRQKKIYFNQLEIQKQKNWLLDYFKDKGFFYAIVVPHIDYKGEQVFIRWDIDPGPCVYFGKTIMTGCTKVPFSCIQRTLPYQPGQAWSQKKLKQTFLYLKDLDLFESIQCVPIKNETNHGERTIILKLQEDDPFELRLRLGLELEYVKKYHTLGGITYKVGGTFLARNPSSYGDQFRLDADITRVHREIIARYTLPPLFPIPIINFLQAYSISYDEPGFIGNKKNIYNVMQNGVLWGIRKKRGGWQWGINIGFELMETKISVSDVGTFQLAVQLAQAIDFEPRLLGKQVPFIFFEPTLFIDYLDNKLNPTKGSLTILSCKSMIPLSSKNIDSFFIRFMAEQSIFFPLWKIVCAMRFRGGHIFHQRFSAIMPTERFYLGGSHSLRSYETDLAPPLGIFTDCHGKEHVVPRGGKSMLNINGELRFPVFKQVGAVVFQDFGILSGDAFADFKPQNILAGTGFGIRYATPIGPLRFDIGWKWRVIRPFERSFAWFLSLGHAF